MVFNSPIWVLNGLVLHGSLIKLYDLWGVKGREHGEHMEYGEHGEHVEYGEYAPGTPMFFSRSVQGKRLGACFYAV